jgi:hypothetical protein
VLELVAAAADGDPVVDDDDDAVVEVADVVAGAVEEVFEPLAVVDTGAICTMLADPDCNTRVAVRVL